MVTEFFAWCAFLGAWLLVAGPVYQAALELEEEGVEREALHRASAAVPEPEHVSPWWWLVPPVAWWKAKRREGEYRRAILLEMKTEDVAAFVGFVDKAAGWLLVATGGLLLAANESWQLVEDHDWPHWAAAPFIFGMGGLALSYTVFRMKRSHGVLDESRVTQHA
jgi:hypothetical protein